MNPLEDKLRTAFRETADELPASPPPLDLSRTPRPSRKSPGRKSPARKSPARKSPARKTQGHRGWVAWVAPLAAAAVVVVVVLVSLAVTGGHGALPAPASRPGLSAVPPYYVALTTPDKNSSASYDGATAAEVRATATGALLAKVVPPKPYVTFNFVSGAADDHTFVLLAQEPYRVPNLSGQQMDREYPDGYNPGMRFYLLHIDSAHSRMSLQALPAGLIPSGEPVHDMALSPDGTSLAANVGGLLVSPRLSVINVATGAERTWSEPGCRGCQPSGGGLTSGGVNTDALSWTADGKHLAFFYGNTVRLLDTSDQGSGLLANSKSVAVWNPKPQPGRDVYAWRGAVITPDGQKVLGIEERGTDGHSAVLRVYLVVFSAATGRPTATLNNLNGFTGGYEQVLFTTASGNVLVITGARPGNTAGLFSQGRYTPLPWSPYIGAAAW